MPVGRLRPGVTRAQAQMDMDVIARRLAEEYPATNKALGAKVVPLHQEMFEWAGQLLYPLLGAVVLVLLIACVNVANLFQSRTRTGAKSMRCGHRSEPAGGGSCSSCLWKVPYSL
jgi:hypothetical protein